MIDGYKRDRGAGATGPGHGGSGGLADERGRGAAAGPLAALSPNRRRRWKQGWLLAELEQRFGYGLDELARRFDRSVSWVSRRLALVEVLPEAIQQQVREGKIAAQVAMKYLVPVARVNAWRIASGWRPLFAAASLRYAASRATVCGLARRLARGPRTHSGRAGAVFENAAAGSRQPSRRRSNKWSAIWRWWWPS